MTKTLLKGFTALTLIMAGPAFAGQQTNNTNDYNNQAYSSDNQANNRMTLNATLIDDNDDDVDYEGRETIIINERDTADYMLGKSLMNERNEEVANIRDILVNMNGDAKMVVLEDADWMSDDGMVVIDYGQISNNMQAGTAYLAISGDLETNSSMFSYDDETQYSADTFSVEQILDAHLEGRGNENLADVTNVVFNNGKIEKVIVDIDENLGLSAHHVAIDFKDLNIMRNGDDETVFTLSSAQARQFETLKKSL